MSGPKKSSWEIRQEIRQERQRIRDVKRNSQINDILNKLNCCQNNVDQLISIHGQYAKNIKNRINDWSVDVRLNCNYDLRDAWHGLKGIQTYLENQKKRLTLNAERIKQRQTKKNAEKEAERQRIETIEAELREKKEAERLKQEKIDRAIESLTSIRNNYPDIMNAGIEQRIELFTKSLMANPDNRQTLSQIRTFREKLSEEIDKFDEEQDNIKYVKETFSSVLGGTSSEGEDGSSIINGKIDGVPISVQINKSGNNIRFDTPTDGSCKKGLNGLIKSLNAADISLGPINIINTGETISSKASTYRETSINA